MNSISLTFTRTSHPYPEEPSSPMEIWGKIILTVINNKNETIQTLFDIEWDVKPLIEWLNENKSFLLTEDFLVELPANGSIARSVHDYYDSITEEINDDLLDKLYEYRTRHGLHFALGGVEIPDIYLGQFQGQQTVSGFTDDVEFSYNISFDRLFSQVATISQDL